MKDLPPIAEFFDDEPIITPSVMHSGDKIEISVRNKTAICTFLCENIDKEILAPILKNCRLLFYVYGRSGKVPVFQYKDVCLIVLMTVGSPVAAAVIEELKNLEINDVIAFGTAGLLDVKIPQDSFVLVEKAIRDEGASYHYLAPSVYVETDKQLTDWVENFLKSNGIEVVRGITWTTDALFRETGLRAAKRREQGAIVVDMECAGFAAAAKRLGIHFSQFMFYSDALDCKTWTTFGGQTEQNTRRSLKVTLLQALLNVMEK